MPWWCAPTSWAAVARASTGGAPGVCKCGCPYYRAYHRAPALWRMTFLRTWTPSITPLCASAAEVCDPDCSDWFDTWNVLFFMVGTLRRWRCLMPMKPDGSYEDTVADMQKPNVSEVLTEEEYLEEVRKGNVLPVDFVDGVLISEYGNAKREAKRKRKAAERVMNARGNSGGNLKLPLTTGEQFLVGGVLIVLLSMLAF